MYLPVPSQPDCAAAWREGLRAVLGAGGHASNVILDIEDPIAGNTLADPVVGAVDAYLQSRNVKPLSTVANTLFPEALYRRYGAPDVYDRFMSRVLPAAAKEERWSGYYFERMINLRTARGGSVNQLADIISRIADPKVKALNKFEFTIFDPTRDVDRSPYGGQCLSHGSFKLRKTKSGVVLDLTATYRNHFYVEKLLGNLIGLGRLMAFVASESGIQIGALTIVSTHALADLPKNAAGRTATKTEIRQLLERCDALASPQTLAA
nr:hypothetical protein [uncultured Brevundimonas sp.]